MQVAEKNRLSRASETVQLDIKAHIEEIQQRIESLNEQISPSPNSKPIGNAKMKSYNPLKGSAKFHLPMFGGITRDGNTLAKNRLPGWSGSLLSTTIVASTRVNA